MNIGCCKNGSLIQVIVADSIKFCQDHLSDQYDTFFDLTSYYQSNTTHLVNSFLASKNITVPQESQPVDIISNIIDDVKQIDTQLSISPIKPLIK